MKRVLRGAIALALSGAVPAGAAWAARDPTFPDCDGYPTAKKSGDGLTSGSFTFGLASRDITWLLKPLVLNEAGAASCDRALAVPVWAETHWVRRGNLLVFKAWHLAAAGKPEAAMAALDAADAHAQGRTDALYDGSVGIAGRLLRAYLIGRAGDSGKAIALLDGIERQRPYATNIRLLAAGIRGGLGRDPRMLGAAFERLMPIYPGAGRTLFWLAIAARDFEGAVRYSSQLDGEAPQMLPGWTAPAAGSEVPTDIANVGGATAYALDMLGRSDEAKEQRATTRAQLAGHQWALPALEQWAVRGEEPIPDLKDMLSALVFDLSAQAMTIPRPEIAKMTQGFRKVGGLFGVWNGYTVLPDFAGSATISYAGIVPSKAMVEEMALLAAAKFARDSGKTSFLIQSRAVNGRVLNQLYIGSTLSLYAGYEVRLRVHALNADEAHPSLARRLISADQVRAALLPRYGEDKPKR